VSSTGLTTSFDEVDRLGDEVRTTVTARAPSSQFLEARLVKVVSYPVLLARWISAAPSRHLSSEQDASHQSLQPTCCHEHPLEHAIPKLRAFTLSTASGFAVSRTEWELGFPHGSTFCDARRPLLAFPALGSQAVGAASASYYRITTPRGMHGVPSKRPCGRSRPAMTWVTRIVDAPCRIPPTCPASRARLRVPGPASPRSTKSAVSQARDAFHQQVPPSLPDSHRPRTGEPPLVFPAHHRGPSFRHAFTSLP
jgi:hypothetical protein